MIKVCTKTECWSFPNAKLNAALAFARIGSQHSERPRRVTICGRFARVYADGIKTRGSVPVSRLRALARACR